MADVVIYDEVTNYVKSYQKSTHTPDYSGRTDVVIYDKSNPPSNLQPLIDANRDFIVPLKYWKHSGGSIVEMTQAEKDARDAELATEKRDGIRQATIADLNNNRTLKAALLVILDEMNLQHGTNRTPTQFLNAIVGKINNGEVD